MNGNTDKPKDVQELQAIMQQYEDLFEVPIELPLSREHGHKITLNEDTSPINIRPYRYLAVQKHEIEKMVDKILESGMIRPNISPYFSPIVMVKKKYGSCRMCGLSEIQ